MNNHSNPITTRALRIVACCTASLAQSLMAVPPTEEAWLQATTELGASVLAPAPNRMALGSSVYEGTRPPTWAEVLEQLRKDRGRVGGPFTPTLKTIPRSRAESAVKEAFPKLGTQLSPEELAAKIEASPSMRGNLRGRLAELDWGARHKQSGWLKTASRTAPENDFWNLRLNEGTQVKVHNDPADYLRSMKADSKAERFVIPDDHLKIVQSDLDERIAGAKRGGQLDKVKYYEAQKARLRPLGRIFSELDDAATLVLRHPRASWAARVLPIAGGVVAAGALVGFIEGGIAVYQWNAGNINDAQLNDQLWRAGYQAVAASGVTGVILLAAPGAPFLLVAIPAVVTAVVVDMTFDWATESENADWIPALTERAYGRVPNSELPDIYAPPQGAHLDEATNFFAAIEDRRRR